MKKILSIIMAMLLLPTIAFAQSAGSESPASKSVSPEFAESESAQLFDHLPLALPTENASPSLSSDTESAGSHRVYATISPTFALCERLLRGIEEFSLTQLIQPQMDCIRLYNMSDWDYVQLSFAETCVIWGNSLESFEQTLITASSGPAIITLSDAPTDFNALPAELSDYDFYEHFSGENPHSYMSLDNMSHALDSLYNSLVELYPEHIGQLKNNYEAAQQLFVTAQSELGSIKSTIPAKTYAALYESASYLLDELGANWVYSYPREPSSEVSDADLDDLLARLDSDRVDIVVLENQAPASLKRALISAGYDVRSISSLLTLNSPMLEDYLAAFIADANTLAA